MIFAVITKEPTPTLRRLTSGSVLAHKSGGTP